MKYIIVITKPRSVYDEYYTGMKGKKKVGLVFPLTSLLQDKAKTFDSPEEANKIIEILVNRGKRGVQRNYRVIKKQ